LYDFQLIGHDKIQLHCVFPNVTVDYLLQPPPMEPNISINLTNFKKIIQFCMYNKSDILINYENKKIILNDISMLIGISLDVEYVLLEPDHTIQLDNDSCNFMLSFFNNYCFPTDLLFLIFLDIKYSFSFKINVSTGESVQIFTIHKI
jgi:hypothetical protein